MNRRRVGQVAAAFVALACFAWAAWAAHSSSIPAVKVYDGYWMMLGAAIGMIVVGPLVWHWPRERSLVAITLTSVVGCVAPLAISAARHHMPLLARLRGSWIIGGADLVGPAVVIGCLSLWFALREHRTERSGQVSSGPG
jgi:hypothetical protein